MKSTCQRLFVLLAAITLCACSDNPQAEAGNEGDVSQSSLTYYTMTPEDSEPTVRQMTIESITCEIDPEDRQVRIDLGEEGNIQVRDEHRLSETAWLIVVDLTELDIPGGKRENIVPSHGGDPFNMDDAGNIQGVYTFRLYGDLEGQYGFEMDIRC